VRGVHAGRRRVGGVTRLSVVGVPDSAGSYAAGQEQAPAALRAAGLIDALAGTGLDVHDNGDLPTQIWQPDRVHPYAQNVEQVVTCLRALTVRIGPLLAAGDTVLVLGGNCTIALAVMAGLQQLDAGVPGLFYVDRQFDLNTPVSTTDGALDWMGLAHGLSLPGCVDDLADAFGRRPLLLPKQVAWLGVDSSLATEWEREQALRLGLHVSSSESFSADPTGTAASALQALPSGPLAVHIDVDVLDFTDAPLAENTDGRNTGPTLNQLGQALRVAATDSRLRAVSIGELNPTRAAGDPDAILRFIDVIAANLGSTAHYGIDMWDREWRDDAPNSRKLTAAERHF
jgi:arginase